MKTGLYSSSISRLARALYPDYCHLGGKKAAWWAAKRCFRGYKAVDRYRKLHDKYAVKVPAATLQSGEKFNFQALIK